MDTQTLLMVFVGLTGAAVLLQAFVLLGIFLTLRKTAKSVNEVTDDLKATVIPWIHSSKALMERISPQILTISSGLADLTEIVQKEVHEAKVSFSEMAARVNRQTERLDSMLTSSLNTVEHIAVAVESRVAAPVRQANGIMAGIKAAVDTYRKWPGSSAEQSTAYVYPDPDRDIVL